MTAIDAHPPSSRPRARASSSIDPALSASVSDALGAEVLLAVAREPAPLAALSWGEVGRLSELATEGRRDEWRLGRAALKAALRAAGEPDDTSTLAFPHPRLSLTHSGARAVAAIAPRGGVSGLAGLGVDVELDREARLEAARFFLTDGEQAWLRAQPEADRRAHLLRLWTIKEAVFKADPRNAETTLRDYRILHPDRAHGDASRDAARFTYVATRWGDATLSVAAHRAPTPTFARTAE